MGELCDNIGLVLACLLSGSTNATTSPSRCMTKPSIRDLYLVSCTFYACWQSLYSPFLNSKIFCVNYDCIVIYMYLCGLGTAYFCIYNYRTKSRRCCKKQHATPAVAYEEVGVAGEVEKSHDIQLTSNEAYGLLGKHSIPTSRNAAYGQVQL